MDKDVYFGRINHSFGESMCKEANVVMENIYLVQVTITKDTG